MAYPRLFWVIILLVLVCSLPGLSLMLFADETLNGFRINEIAQGIDPAVYGHPPGRFITDYLNLALTGFFSWFGLDFSLRIIPLLYGMLTLFFVFLLSKKIYGNRTALVATAITGFSFYHIHASVSTDLDGNLLTLLLIASIYFYYSFLQSDNNKELFLSAIIFGFALWTKYTAVILLPILLVFLFFTGRLDRARIKSFVIFFAISAAIISLFPLTMYFLGLWDKFLFTLQWGIANIGSTDKLLLIAKAAFKYTYRIIQYGTPLLFFLPIIAFLKQEKRDEILLFSWAGIGLILLIVFNSHGQLERYAMVLIPALGILSAKVLTPAIGAIKSYKKHFIFLLALFTIMLIAFNAYKFTDAPFSLEFFDSSLLLLNPDVWYTGTAGPVFVLSLHSLLFTAVMGLVIFLFYLISKKESGKHLALIALLALSIPFNFALLEEHFFYLKSPDYNKTIQEMVSFAEGRNLPEPFFSVDGDVPYYLGKKTSGEYFDLSDSWHRVHLKEGGTVFFLNHPEKRNPILWGDVKNCLLLKTIRQKGLETGFILECEKVNE